MPKKPLKYFYLNGLLHKKLQINRGKDTITTWCYPLRKRVAYTYSEVRRNMETAFSTEEVGQMLNRKPRIIHRAIQYGHIEPPQHVYALTNPERKRQYQWCEDDIMNAHDYFSSIHYGRPRKDGLITPYPMPSKREIRALIHQEVILYIENDGEFIPTWKAKEY